MTFNIHPRREIEQLFGRENETKRLMDVLLNAGWSAILGPRMAGKTSLALATSISFARKRKTSVVYLNLSTSRSFRELTARLVDALSRLNAPERITDAEFQVFFPSGIINAGLGVRLRRPDKHRVSLRFEEAVLSLPKNSVVILDEVQEVRGRVDKLTRALWVVFNERPDVRFVFTGSYSGLVRKILKASHEEPMFGRPPIAIKVLPWPRRTAEDFLIEGLKKCGVGYTLMEIEETIEKLGTLPGWLNEYGFRRCIGEPHDEAISIVSDSAIMRAKGELENLLRNRDPKARIVLKKLSEGPKSWGELLKVGLSKPSLDSLLDTLTEGLFLLRREDTGYKTFYSFINPVYREAAKLL